MMLIEAVRKIQKAGMQVLLEANPTAGNGCCGESNMRAYAWSDQNGYECAITMPFGAYDAMDEDEVAVLERVITAAMRPVNAISVRNTQGDTHEAR
jgi:hypothetical protein